MHTATISVAVMNAQGKLLMACVLETKAAMASKCAYQNMGIEGHQPHFSVGTATTCIAARISVSKAALEPAAATHHLLFFTSKFGSTWLFSTLSHEGTPLLVKTWLYWGKL